MDIIVQKTPPVDLGGDGGGTGTSCGDPPLKTPTVCLPPMTPPPHSPLPILVSHGTLSHRTTPTWDPLPIFHRTPCPSFLGPPLQGTPTSCPIVPSPTQGDWERFSPSHTPPPLLWGSFRASWTLPPPTPQPLTSMPPKGVTGDTEVTPVLILAQGGGEEKGGAPPLCWHSSPARFLHPSPWEPWGQGHGATIPGQRVPPPWVPPHNPCPRHPTLLGGGSRGASGGFKPFPNPAPPAQHKGQR